MRTIALILLVSFVFTLTVMCAEPQHPLCRIFLFPGLAIVFGIFHVFRTNLVGRAPLVWYLSTALNTLIYSATICLFLGVMQRFSSGRHPAQH
jgi:hypothetical protein